MAQLDRRKKELQEAADPFVKANRLTSAAVQDICDRMHPIKGVSPTPPQKQVLPAFVGRLVLETDGTRTTYLPQKRYFIVNNQTQAIHRKRGTSANGFPTVDEALLVCDGLSEAVIERTVWMNEYILRKE